MVSPRSLLGLVDHDLQIALEAFFADFAAAISDGEMHKLEQFFHLPMVFMEDSHKTVCADKNTLHSKVGEFLQSERVKQGQRHQASVTHVMQLSETVLFAQVEWHWMDEEGVTHHRSVTSYTLQQVAKHQFEIIIAVIDSSTREAEAAS